MSNNSNLVSPEKNRQNTFDFCFQKISNELQQLAEAVYDKEQSICSQRALRLKTGRNDFGQSRSLIQLTGIDSLLLLAHYYSKLYRHFSFGVCSFYIT